LYNFRKKGLFLGGGAKCDFVGGHKGDWGEGIFPPAYMLKKALTVKVLVHGLEIVCLMVNIYVMLKAVVHSSMLIST
jgi:hypothetical protein